MHTQETAMAWRNGLPDPRVALQAGPRATSGSMPTPMQYIRRVEFSSGSSGFACAAYAVEDVWPAGWTQEQIDVEIERRNEVERRAQKQARIAQELRLRAEEKSFALLMEFLTAMQRDQLITTGTFIVRGHSRVRYRIRRNQQVEELDWRGKTSSLYCAISTRPVPSGDLMLAQKLMIENDEDRFLKTANRFNPLQ